MSDEYYEPDDYEDDDYYPDEDEEDMIDGVGFADPGGKSALRAATPENPRIYPCPSCHAPNALTQIDVSRGYQCDGCANAAEQGYDRSMRCGGAEGGCELCKENES